MKNKNIKIKNIILINIISLFFVAALYVNKNLASSNLESVIFYLITDMADSDPKTIYIALIICLPIVILLSIALYAIFFDITLGKYKNNIYPFKHFNKYRKIYLTLLLIISFVLLLQSVKTIEYIIDLNSNSSIIKDNYIPAQKVNIEFPNNKRNLIIISVESLENTLFTQQQRGNWEYEIIKELYDIRNADNAITFNKNNGMYMLTGASYTTSSLIANASGVPVKVGTYYNGYKKDHFMNGLYTLGDLLKDNNYNNEVISGAKTSFGGLDNYYQQHGNYNILDSNTLEKKGYKLSKDDYGAWGFNDNYLFNLAKKRLEVLSKKDEPFNLNLITIDTHFVDGYVGNYSETTYDKQYENAYATTSKIINDFINYLKEQPYYENTTIVIVGDHLIMQSNFVNDKMFDNRTIYFCILNSANKEYKEDRIFTALDTYPTIVSSLGGTIENEQLGLGVNLFSDKKTLAEKYGIKKLDKELKKKSKYYDKIILGEK